MIWFLLRDCPYEHSYHEHLSASLSWRTVTFFAVSMGLLSCPVPIWQKLRHDQLTSGVICDKALSRHFSNLAFSFNLIASVCVCVWDAFAMLSFLNAIWFLCMEFTFLPSSCDLPAEIFFVFYSYQLVHS